MSSASTSTRGGGSDQPPNRQRRIMRTQTAGTGETMFDSEVVPSAVVGIAPFLRVANEVEKSNARVANLCKSMPSFAIGKEKHTLFKNQLLID